MNRATIREVPEDWNDWRNGGEADFIVQTGEHSVAMNVCFTDKLTEGRVGVVPLWYLLLSRFEPLVQEVLS